MKTGIIILNYNDAENTIKMLEQIKNYKCLNKIVIVDNHSTDNSIELLTPHTSKKIVLLTAKKNKGYASGNNIGLKYLEKETDCELAIISNPDIHVEESVITELINDMKKNSDISFLGPKILERGRISKGWKLPTFLSEFVSNLNYFNRYSHKMLRYKEEYYQEKLTQVDVIHGCFFLARLKDFKKIHYFDENTFLYYEENIIGHKSKQNNLKVYIDTTVSVLHDLSVSVDKSLKKISKYKAVKKSMFYYEKEYVHRNIIGYGILKLSYYLCLGISYLTFWI